ncbi:uncharacterized protein LOC106752417 [Vigna radiata var. radiata]|uniref:Uncharacterized protein LOC106752417 n=1 Tax=Vigna radiata var. radiata TaxID=3916 RepID=A0A1S3T745_VIGRR|nr:uncharacterized protein LOC106752417 [Vigna radiata var. radiata]
MDLIQQSLDRLVHVQSLHHTTGGSTSTNSNNGDTHFHKAFHVKEISLGFPYFDGHCPVLEWIFKAEKFFDYHHTPDADGVDIAAIHFEKDVVPWFQMLQRLSAITTWAELTAALESQFGHSPFECSMAELFKLQQTGSVFEYYLKFMALANRSSGLSADALLNCFLSGLHTEIRRDVIALSPTSLLKAVGLAKLYEERYLPTLKNSPMPIRCYSPVVIASNNVSQPSSKSIVKSSLPPLLPTPHTPPFKDSTIKKISAAEMQIRREKGWCYFCDEKFTFNNRCSNRQILQLEDPVNEEGPASVDTGQSLILEDTQVDNHHLSLNALKGGTGVGTIIFLAYVDKLPISVLIDGGSSDNFLQPRIAKFLKLPVEPALTFKVMVGNGNYMTADGLIQNLTIQAQGNTFQFPVYILPISGADLILGASEVEHIPMSAHLHHIRRMVMTHSIAEVYTMEMVDPSPTFPVFPELPMDMKPELALLLSNYVDIFATPTSLPPSRAHDHSIPLLEGAGPVKVKLYRYPHSKKEEIEKLIADMLRARIIQPSKSPFSSPIILVKKKDGSWRVCTDYRALNAITIKDSFPIPTMDELIDKLFGDSFFSKLDLRSGYHQVLLNPEDRHKTAFRTHHGHL